MCCANGTMYDTCLRKMSFCAMKLHLLFLTLRILFRHLFVCCVSEDSNVTRVKVQLITTAGPGNGERERALIISVQLVSVARRP